MRFSGFVAGFERLYDPATPFGSAVERLGFSLLENPFGEVADAAFSTPAARCSRCRCGFPDKYARFSVR
jgi:hypothetical protein